MITLSKVMHLFNYLTHKTEELKPLAPPKISLYTCGPTVYDYAHIGNLRTYIFEDLLRRTLEYLGYKVEHIMNITDIEDKIVKRAREEEIEFTKITGRYTKTFKEDLAKLNILPAKRYPTVTDHIPKIIKLVQVLIDKQYAYIANDGSVYFDISSFDGYGKLARLDKQTLREGASGRILDDEYSKDEINDFVLWKAKTKKNEPSWPSPWVDGRPGWHIECSVLSMEYLGPQIDIHAGAVDLIFPHHTNEIAQSEAATGKKFVNYWLEGEHLLVDGKKMSKSKDNYYTLRDIEEKNFNPLAFRYLALQTHYRKKLNFTWEGLEAAQGAFKNLQTAVVNLHLVLKCHSGGSTATSRVQDGGANEYHHMFLESISDDLNIPQALAVTWQLVDDNQLDASTKLTTLLNFDRVLGLQLDQIKAPEIPQEIHSLLERRGQLRATEEFTKADNIRKKIQEKGFQIEDTPQGPILKTTSPPK